MTDSLGVDVYPVTLDNPGSPYLHEVGVWTRTIAASAGDPAVWTTLQICSKNAYNKRTGAYVLPSAYQERYMVYDAIINSASVKSGTVYGESRTVPIFQGTLRDSFRKWRSTSTASSPPRRHHAYVTALG